MEQTTSSLNTFKSDFLLTMAERNLINQCTNFSELDRKLTAGPITAYIGFDATADSLHAGHLLSLISMRKLAAAGHQVIALLGGATTLVGDPSFRSESRPILDDVTIRKNMHGILCNIERILGPHTDKLIVVDNNDWLGEAKLINFMREVGSNFTIARMLSMDSVKSRLDHGLTMLEFSYMMLQSADFLELSRRHSCTLQIGGSDQWGNIVNGIDLARKSDGKELFGLTTPLLTTKGGHKMGKTANGAVWLSNKKMPSNKFWQFWRNTNDEDVRSMLQMLTDVPLDVIESVCQHNINEAKVLLANQVTALVHGEVAANLACAEAQKLFKGERPNEPTIVTVDGNEIGLLDLLIKLQFCKSKGEARRLIEGNAVKIDDDPVADNKLHLAKGLDFIIASGKRNKAYVILN